jgi:hypothetical protein
VYSAFSEFSFKIKKLAVKPGFRIEFSRTGGAVAGGQSFENDYPAYIPTLSLSLPVGSANSIRLAYTRRIQRPGLWYLKPQINDADPRNVSTGNPYLDAELTQGVEIGLNLFKNGQSLDFGLEQSVTRGAINSFTRLDPATGITINTYENLGTNHRTALNASLSVSLGKKFTGNLEANIAYEVHEGFAGVAFYRNNGWTGHLGGSLQHNLGRGFRLQAGGSGHLGRVQLQGRGGNWFYYQVGLSKSFFENEALRLTVQLDHFLQQDRLWRSEFTDPLFSTVTEVAQPVRALRLGLQYRFGRLSENVSRKRGVSNTDKKAGE